MRLTLRESFYKMLFPLLAVGIVGIIFNINSLTFKKLIEILIALILVSSVGGVLIYTSYFLYDKYENGVLNRIIRKYNGTRSGENVVKFDYHNIEVFCIRTMNYKRMQNEFNFHVPRKYIQKRHRKDVDFMKPSNVSGEECFQIQSWLYITKRRLNILEDKLDVIVEINE